MSVKRNSIIQATEGDWEGYLFIVDEVKSWGVQAFSRTLSKDLGEIFIRLNNDEFEHVGESLYGLQDEEE